MPARVHCSEWISLLLGFCVCASLCPTLAASTNFDLDKDRLVSVPSLGHEKVWQGFRAIQYGSMTSNDIATAIGTDTDGNAFIAGTTSPDNSSTDGWGNMAPGDQSAGKDGFIAKLTGSGDLAWVRRFGSPRDEVVLAMVVTSHAVYICGETEGDLGLLENAGGKDVFVVKYSLTGAKLWANPFQIGSDANDSCRDIVVSDKMSKTPSIFISGSTSGIMFPGQVGPRGGASHRFLAKLSETHSETSTGPTVTLKRGVQRGSLGMNSADCLVVGLRNHLYLITNQYRSSEELDAQANAVLEMYDQEVLAVHQTEQLKVDPDRGFFATRAVLMPGTGDLYVAGALPHPKKRAKVTTETSLKRSFGVIKLRSNPENATVSLDWTAKLGSAVLPLQFLTGQKVTIAVDVMREQVHVAGVLDGYYSFEDDQAEGLLSAPFYSLHASNGSVARYVLRTTEYPTNVEEITDIVVHPDNRCVIYCGIRSRHDKSGASSDTGGSNSRQKAVVGSLGSPMFFSRLSSVPISQSLEAAGVPSSVDADGSSLSASDNGEDEKENGSPRLGAAGGAAIGVSAVGGTLLLAVFVSSLARNSGRQLSSGGWDSSAVNGQVQQNGMSGIGGSAAPQ